MMKTSVLTHKEACLHELKTLYRQLQLLSYQNQLLNKRKHKANDHALAQNKKLQMVIKEKLKAVNKFIEKMTDIIEKKNETEQINLVTSPVNKITICNTHRIEPENILQKYVMKSPYSKVNTDRKLWLRRPTLTPITLRHASTVISSKSKQVKVESKDAQTNTLSKSIEQNVPKLNVIETAKETPTYNIIHYDSEMHWCNVCNVFPKTAKDYLNHLHTTRHKTLISEKNKVELPWHESKINEITKPEIEAGPTKRKPIRGLQFLIPATAWYCKLCLEWIGDLHCASNHLKTVVHAQKYSEFIEENPHWEADWLIERTRAYEQLTDTCCQSDKSKILLKSLYDSPSKVVNKTALDNVCCSLINSVKVKEENKKDSSSDTSTTSSNSKSTYSDISQYINEMNQTRCEISPRRSEKCQRRNAISPKIREKYYTRNKINPRKKEIYLTRHELSPRRSERYRTKIEISSRRNEKYQTRSEMSPRRKDIYLTRHELSPRRKEISLTKHDINSRRKIYEGRSGKINQIRSEVRSQLRSEIHPRKRNELSQKKSEINNQTKSYIHQTRNVQDTIRNINKEFSQNELRKRQSCMKDAVKPTKKFKVKEIFDFQNKSDGECTSSSFEEVIEVEHALSLSNFDENKTKIDSSSSNKTGLKLDLEYNENKSKVTFDLDEISMNKQVAQKEITSSVVSNFKAILSWKSYTEKLIENNILQMSQIKNSIEEKTMLNIVQVKPLSSIALMKIESIRSDPQSLQIMEKLMNSWRAAKSKIININSNNFEFKLPIQQLKFS